MGCVCRNASAHEARTAQPRAQNAVCCAVRKRTRGGIDYVALHIDSEMGRGWHDLGSDLQGIFGTIPGEALTSNKNFQYAKENPSIFGNNETGILISHALHRTLRGPSPPRIAFHHRM